LHDGLCQNLAGIAALSSTLSRKLAADSEPAPVEAAEIARLLNETIGHARDLARGLNPVGLEQVGLAAALEAFAANVQALFRVSCRFQCNRSFLGLAPEVAEKSIARERPTLHFDGRLDRPGLQHAIALQHHLGAIKDMLPLDHFVAEGFEPALN